MLQTVVLIPRATTKKIIQKYIVKGMTRELNSDPKLMSRLRLRQ